MLLPGCSARKGHKALHNAKCKREIEEVRAVTLSMGTPWVSGNSRSTKMRETVCHAPKNMNTPYFRLHIIIRNTCTALGLSQMLCI